VYHLTKNHIHIPKGILGEFPEYFGQTKLATTNNVNRCNTDIIWGVRSNGGEVK
jgi:hypothetical protein